MSLSSRHHRAKVHPRGCCLDTQSSDILEEASSRPQGRGTLLKSRNKAEFKKSSLPARKAKIATALNMLDLTGKVG